MRRLKFVTSPLVVAVAFGVLGPAALEEDDDLGPELADCCEAPTERTMGDLSEGPAPAVEELLQWVDAE